MVVGTRFPMWLRIDDSITHQKVRRGTVRRILPYAKPYRWALVLLLLVTGLDATITVANPLLLGLIIDRGILPHRLGIVIVLSVIVAVLGLVDAAAIYLQTWSSSRIGQGLILDLRSKVFTHVQQQPLAFFTRSQTGSLVSRLNTDVLRACAERHLFPVVADRRHRAGPDAVLCGAHETSRQESAAACPGGHAARCRAWLHDE